MTKNGFAIARLASSHAISEDAVKAVLRALRASGGGMAQFSHSEFGGMSQEEAKTTVNQLLRWQLVHTKTRGDIGMSATLVAVVRELEEED